MSGDDDLRAPATPAIELLGGGETSLLDTVDGLLNQGVLLSGDLVLGLADVDLVYLRLETLLAAADRVLGTREERAPTPGGADRSQAARRPDRAAGTPPAAVERPTARAEAQPARGQGEDASGAPGGAQPGTAHLDALRDELEQALGARPSNAEELDAAGRDRRPPRWNAEPEDVERSVARLVLALVEFLRKLMERQAIRRMEEGTLTETQVERLGQALMRLEETVHELARRFGLRPDELNLDLGPLGTLT